MELTTSEREARENDLRHELGQALENYQHAEGSQRNAARTYYLHLLRQFREYISE